MEDIRPFPSSPNLLKAFVGVGYIVEESRLCASNPHQEFEKVNVLFSSSGARYELGRTLKRAIYGVVIHATLLSPVISSVNGASQQAARYFRRTTLSYAIKIFSKELIYQLSQKSKENPLHELSVLQYIGDSFPNLIGSIECCTDSHYIYSIMRFCSGGELFDYILANGKLQENEAKSIFYNILLGLQVMEDLGIAHLDLSLENILYNQEGKQIMIIDYGMSSKLVPVSTSQIMDFGATNNFPAKSVLSPISSTFVNSPLSSNSAPTQVPVFALPNPAFPLLGSRKIQKFQPIINNHCGKRNYMAPEIIADVDYVDALSCDIWSAGICLLFLLLGFPPIEIACPSDIRYNLLVNGELKTLLQHWSINLSDSVIDLIQRILRVDPSERMSIEEILAHPWMNDVTVDIYNDYYKIRRSYSITSVSDLPSTTQFASVPACSSQLHLITPGSDNSDSCFNRKPVDCDNSGSDLTSAFEESKNDSMICL